MSGVSETLKVISSKLSRRSFVSALAVAPLGLATLARAEDPANIGSITSIAPRIAMQGKLATKTEVVQGQGQAPMITLGSLSALDGAISMYQEIVAGGGWPTLAKAKYDKTSKPADIFRLRQRLVREGYLEIDNLADPSAKTFDTTLLTAIKAFQFNHGASPNGKIDERTRAEMNISAEARLYTLQENRPRVAEHLKDLGPRYVAVNIPAAQLETVELGEIYSRHNVVVGKMERPTPSLKSKVSDIVFNPFWNAPASIVARDIIPKYLADPNYLDQLGIRVIDGTNGMEVEPSSVDWQNTPADRFQFRQDPGKQNALATMKVNFPNKFMVYMHDTPHRELFAGNARFESSGCVRVDQVATMINWILNGQDGIDPARIDAITAAGETLQTKVKNSTDVRFMYLTAWATEDGRVNFRPDVYKLDGKGFILGQPDPVVAL
ncbi:MAG: L,D-transpeptidase family protein [Alphaproteobacteria bacterium]|nr:L,D-transpeptidase family protein [Alphaproteobacteria bacterium]